MSADLIEIRERLRYQLSKIESLEKDLTNYAGESIIFRREHNGDAIVGGTDDGEYFSLFAVMMAPVPISVRADAGLIANELRSCLDALACVLATRNLKSPKSTYFPISKTKCVFFDDGVKKLRNISIADQHYIMSIKPYGGGNSVLYGLHEIDRTRKHTRLGVWATGSSVEFFAGERPYQATFDTLNTHLTDVGVEVRIAAGTAPKFASIGGKVIIGWESPEEVQGVMASAFLSKAHDAISAIVRRFDK